MTIWLLALLLTAITCATLLYAGAGRRVNAGAPAVDATAEHFRAQLRSIEADAASGRLGTAEAIAAKSELAREVMRHKAETGPKSGGTLAVWLPVVLVAAISLGTYGWLGRPDLPAAPLASRDAAAEGALTLDAAVRTIEARLAENPDDLRGWTVIAPAYMQLGLYEDAERALRRVNELGEPTADTLTDLAEALMMQQGGAVEGEPMELLRRAYALDPTHVRSLYYIAGEETRVGDFPAAIRDWNALLALSQGGEPWVVTAQNGLAYAEAGGNPDASAPAQPDQAQIDAMVDGLAQRLEAEGGSVEEWTQLVRARLVQGRTADAQAAYDTAREAYPDPAERSMLDVLATDNGLVTQ
ncbi:MAG TPA: c-type cytochrome biogenesis protein CcmI [Devosia sp.]|jgi:cytochrome c-type biogenesis protein CcmH|nr:c-type cytochrome biogenesis protein CcmI [Devosia sp.]